MPLSSPDLWASQRLCSPYFFNSCLAPFHNANASPPILYLPACRERALEAASAGERDTAPISDQPQRVEIAAQLPSHEEHAYADMRGS